MSAMSRNGRWHEDQIQLGSTRSRVARWFVFKPKIPIWVTLRSENVSIFYGDLEYFNDIWEILWSFGTVCVHLIHFSGFWYHVSRKIWQP
jgi:hypothetical protein